MVWIKFLICILVIFFSGKAVAKYGDIIAERTKLGRVWIGVIAVALITSLPELFTGISAVTIIDAPDLTVGDLIGANAFNLFNLAVLDIFHRDGSLLAGLSPTHTLTSWYSLVILVVVGISLLVSTYFYSMPLGWIGWYTPVIILLYFVLARRIYLFDKHHPSQQETALYSDGHSTRRVFLYFGIAAVLIIGAGIWLATIGDEIARVTGWGQSFVGSLFLAFTTTMPEITVSIAAIRIGAKDLAVANMVGSNLFNLTIIPITDIIYTRGPILSAASPGHLMTIGSVLVITLLFIAGLRFVPKRHLRLSWFNTAIIAVFIIGAYLSFVQA